MRGARIDANPARSCLQTATRATTSCGAGWRTTTLLPSHSPLLYVRLESAAFPKLWEWCCSQGVKVVADVHTHPGGPRQSPSDRAHPMVLLAGHVALIIPRFARGSPRPRDASFNVYKGAGRWDSFYQRAAEALIVAS